MNHNQQPPNPGLAIPKRPPQPIGFTPRWLRDLSPIERDAMPELMVGQGINDEPVEIEYHI